MADEDVPSPIDFHDIVQARAWEANTVERRPWRPKFFRMFAEVLNAHAVSPLTVLELGSGPGHLAEAIFSSCNIQLYTALDFSDAMHSLARARLKPFLYRTQFITRDFRDAQWPDGLGLFDAVVTLQAAHEVRHVRRLPDLLARARRCVAPGGLLLFCDHYVKPDTDKPPLYMPREEQPPLLEAAGFSDVTRVLDEGGMALYRAQAT